MATFWDDLDEKMKQQEANPLAGAIQSDMLAHNMPVPDATMTDAGYQLPPIRKLASKARPEAIDFDVQGPNAGVMAGMGIGNPDSMVQPADDVSDLVKRTIANRSSSNDKYAQDISGARQLSNNQMLGANIGDAASGLGYALAGVDRPKSSFYDNQRAQAAAIPGQVQEDLKGEGDALKNRVTSELNDPNSDRSNVFKNIFLKTWGDKLGISKQDLQNMSAADVGELEKILSAKANAELKESLYAQRAVSAQAGAERRATDKVGANAKELRKEFLSLPGTKAAQDVKASYEQIKGLAGHPSAANDLTLIYSYMKMLDPGSTVREGEFATAQNAASIPDQIRNQWNKAVSGERLNPEQRKQFLQGAESVYQSRIKSQLPMVKRYKELAENLGVDPKQVVFELDPDSPPVAPSGDSGWTPDKEAQYQKLLKKRGN